MITVKAYAKINLTLDVLGKRENGYHDVEMIMHQVDLCDLVTVAIEESSDNISLSCTDHFLPVDEQNIAYRAAAIMKNKFHLKCGFKIHIEKNIPVAAGLAGGSSNAAAVITAINEICNLSRPREELMQIGFELGADVPFCIHGGCAIARGLGEELEAIKGLEHTFLVLVKPNFGVSTKEIFQNLNLDLIEMHPLTNEMSMAVSSGNRAEVCRLLCNVLEIVTFERYPKVRELKEFIKQYGAEGVLMSGSGPTVFGIYKSYDKAKLAAKKIKKHYPQTYLVSTI